MSIVEPAKIITPWADTGSKNPIPQNANSATGEAGYDKGFPDITMTPREAGGIPPAGQDFNGIFYEMTSILRYMQAGGQPTFDAALATAIGGYPLGAVLIGDDGVSVFQNAVAGNETNPNTGGDGWARPDLQIMELYRRSYAEAGFNVVGAFPAGFTYVNANDVGIDLATGKGYTGPAGAVAAGTNPESGGFVLVGDNVIIRTDSVKKLLSDYTPPAQYGARANVASYHHVTFADAFDTLKGGGTYVWSDIAKSEHDGGVVIDPTRAFPTTWVSGIESDVFDWFFGAPNVGRGCWVRENSADVSVCQYGAKGNFDGTNGTDDSNSFNAATQARKPYNGLDFSNNSALKRVIAVESTKRAYLIGGACYVRKGQELCGLGLGGARVFIKTPAVRAYNWDTFRLGVGLIANPFPAHPVLTAVSGSTYITLTGDIKDGNTYNWLKQGHFIKVGGTWHVVRNVAFTGGNTVIEVITALSSTIAAGTLVEESELNDSGGLPPSISNICTEGGHVGSAVINGNYAAGMTVNTMFITTATLGVYALAGDVNLHTVTFDNGGVGLAISGSRNSVTGCHFFWNNIGVQAFGEFNKAFDWVFSNCTFAYNKFQDFALNLGALGAVKKLNLTGCNFLENAQEATKTGMIHLISGNVDMQLNGCIFSNMKASAIVQSAGGVSKVRVRGCTFDGLKSNDAYIQSTTASGISFRNGELEVSGCSFENLPNELVTFAAGSATTVLTVKNNEVKNCGDGTWPLVYFNANPVFAKATIRNNTKSSGQTGLLGGALSVDYAPRVSLSGNDFAVYTTTGGRTIATIKAVMGASMTVDILANSNPAGSAHYVRSEILSLLTGTVLDGSVSDKIALGVSGLSLAGTEPPTLSYTVGFDVAGVKTRAFNSNKIFDLLITVPDTYSKFTARVR